MGDMPSFLEGSELSKEKLNTIGDLVNGLKDIDKTIEFEEDKLKQLKERRRKLAEETIPNMVLESGLSELKLASGEKVIIKDELKPSIAKKRILDAYEEMINHTIENNEGISREAATDQIDSLFKNVLTVASPSETLEEFLLSEDIIFNKDRSIHHQTLKKYCKGLKEKGQKIPESISVYEYNTTVIK